MRGSVNMQLWGAVWLTVALATGGAFARYQFRTISHGTRLGSNITIALSRQNFEEDYLLLTPQGQTINLEASTLTGVRFYPERSNFISGRVVIGPMTEDLLGIWNFCARHPKGSNAHERCQPANITWASSNPADGWLTRTNTLINHPIHNGFSLTPVVRGNGGLRTCHVITPAGEDIALVADSDYPGIKRVMFEDDVTACGVTFGPFDASFRGSWSLYGTFNSYSVGPNIAIQPLNLEQSGENANGTIPGQPEALPPAILHGARIGTSHSITLSKKDYVEECELQTPNGNKVKLENAQINGVQVYTTPTEFVSCRVVIGPMEESLLGVWTLCGRRTGSANAYDRCQAANITWASNNPQDNWLSTTNPSIDHVVQHGFSVSPVVRGGGGLQSCHVVTPAGEDIALTADSDYPGLQRVLFDDDVRACSVIIGPLDNNFLGSWTLYGTFKSNSIGFNVATQPMRFVKGKKTALIWSLVVVFSLVVLVLGVMLGPKRNREWTYDRTNRIRNSLRTTLVKDSPPYNRN
ncbi:hypothetical protein O0L34_g3167 [Tuta absoluta]|nr:hypothetical protein O0L34_g3167 [Tuta absoluta]